MRNSKRTAADWGRLVRESRDLKNALSAATQTLAERTNELREATEEIERLQGIATRQAADAMLEGLSDCKEKLLELLREAEPLVARFETAVSKHVPDCLLNRIREALA